MKYKLGARRNASSIYIQCMFLDINVKTMNNYYYVSPLMDELWTVLEVTPYKSNILEQCNVMHY